MGQLDLISRPRLDKGKTHRMRAFLASCVFHGLALGLILWLTFLYRSQMPPIKSGSAPGTPSISLEKMVVVSPSRKPPAQPPKSATAIPTPAPPVIAATPPREPEFIPAPPEATIPFLAVQSDKPAQAIQKTRAETRAASQRVISRMSSSPAQSKPEPAAAAPASSYAAGPTSLPHPPYPPAARDLGEAGTVIMNVQFGVKGDVAQAEVAQSSGVPLLDVTTRSYIRRHWHSAAYAGQTVSVPVQYKLENL